jgi:hypothetical protein
VPPEPQLLMRPRKKRRPKASDEWPPEVHRNLGWEAAILWVITLGLWGRTALWFYNGRILGRHDEMYVWVLLLDLLVPAIAVALTIEWWHKRRGSRP